MILRREGINNIQWEGYEVKGELTLMVYFIFCLISLI